MNESEKVTIYEVSYLLLPTIPLSEVEQKAAALKSIVEKAGGTLVADENPVLIDLAYSMTKLVGTTRHKADRGYFGWVKFEITSEGIAAVKKAFDGNDDILRSLIVKTVRENTLLHGKMMLKREENKKPEILHDEGEVVEAEEGAEPVATADEIDKSIDELVVA